MDRALLERMIGAIALVLLLVVIAPALLDGSSEPKTEGFAGGPDEEVRTEIIVLNEPRTAKSVQEPEQPEPSEVIALVRPVPKVKAAGAMPQSNSVVADSSVTPIPAPASGAASQPPAGAAATAAAKSQSVESGSASTPETGAKLIPKPVPQEASIASRPPVEKVSPSGANSDAASPAVIDGFAVQLGSFGQIENARKLAAELTGRGFPAFVRSSGAATATIHRVYAGPRPTRDAAAKLAAVMAASGYKGIVVDLGGASGSGAR